MRAIVRLAWIGVLLFPLGIRAELFGVPLSDSLFTFEIKAPGHEGCLSATEADRGGSRFVSQERCPQVSGREGTFFQVQDSTRGYSYAFFTAKNAEGEVTLMEIRLSFDKKIGYAVSGIGRSAAVRLGGPEIDLGVKIRLLGQSIGSFSRSPAYTEAIDPSSSEQAEFLELMYGDPMESNCCIGCGSLRLCGNVVEVRGCGRCHGGE
ncbi:MAG TPA: hypothetical protein VN851_25320 [Thermoanaerobaculia bacterium]|nr:hypothetical protein [Thermoanaerobaculia bacterium]